VAIVSRLRFSLQPAARFAVAEGFLHDSGIFAVAKPRNPAAKRKFEFALGRANYAKTRADIIGDFAEF